MQSIWRGRPWRKWELLPNFRGISMRSCWARGNSTFESWKRNWSVWKRPSSRGKLKTESSRRGLALLKNRLLKKVKKSVDWRQSMSSLKEGIINFSCALRWRERRKRSCWVRLNSSRFDWSSQRSSIITLRKRTKMKDSSGKRWRAISRKWTRRCRWWSRKKDRKSKTIRVKSKLCKRR